MQGVGTRSAEATWDAVAAAVGHEPDSMHAAQGGKPDLKGPLIAELKDQPAAGAPNVKPWDPLPHSRL